MPHKMAILGNTPLFAEKVPFVRPLLPSFDALSNGTQNIINSGMVTKGQYLQEFEAEAARHLGAKHAIAVSSCTTGLMLVYQGLGLTGDVVVPSFTFMATVSALVWAGLKPIYADVDPGTFNLDPAAAEAAITPSTSAIVAVHNFGNPAEIDALRAVADRHGLRLVFDAAHGFGSLYNGLPVGPQGDAHIFSLSPTKLLIAGEGGIVATDDDTLAQTVRIGREYGNSGNYDSAFAGFNARMPEFNALMGIHSLAMLEQAACHRNEVAQLYRMELGRVPGVELQEIGAHNRSSYKDFSLVIDPDRFGLTRDELAEALAAENIDTRKYYEPPVHRQTAYRAYDQGIPLPHTERLAERSLSIPIWSHMSKDIALAICQAIKQIQQNAPEVREALTTNSLRVGVH